jgi:MFS family permease
VLCMVVMTLGEIGSTPTAQAVSTRLSPEHLRGRYQGVYQLSWTLSQVIAPLVGASVIGAFGGTPLWVGCFAVTAAAALAYLRIGAHVERRVASARADEQQAAELATA